MEHVPGNMKSRHLSFEINYSNLTLPLVTPPLFLGTALNKQAHESNLIVMVTDDLPF